MHDDQHNIFMHRVTSRQAVRISILCLKDSEFKVIIFATLILEEIETVLIIEMAVHAQK